MIPGSIAQLGSSTPFRDLHEPPRWNVALGGNIPSERELLAIAFAEMRWRGRRGCLGLGLQQESMDSLYESRLWHGDVLWIGNHGFAGFQGFIHQQFWFGVFSTWTPWQKGTLGFRQKNLALSASVLHLTGCLFPEFAIQWSLGECYRMNWMLHQGESEKWSLTIGQQLTIPGNIRLGLGWRLPSQIFAAGISIPLFRAQVESAQFWHPVLPSSQFASGAVQP